MSRLTPMLSHSIFSHVKALLEEELAQLRPLCHALQEENAKLRYQLDDFRDAEAKEQRVQELSGALEKLQRQHDELHETHSVVCFRVNVCFLPVYHR